MAVNDWTLEDSPLPLQGSSPAAAEGTWNLGAVPMVWQTFSVPRGEWLNEVPWTPFEEAFKSIEMPLLGGGTVRTLTGCGG